MGQIYFGKKKYLLYSGILEKGKQVEENQERRDMTEVVDRKICLKPPFIYKSNSDFLAEDRLGKRGLKVGGGSF